MLVISVNPMNAKWFQLHFDPEQTLTNKNSLPPIKVTVVVSVKYRCVSCRTVFPKHGLRLYLLEYIEKFLELFETVIAQWHVHFHRVECEVRKPVWRNPLAASSLTRRWRSPRPNWGPAPPWRSPHPYNCHPASRTPSLARLEPLECL